MDPELEELETSFNSKIEQWLSKQGLFFQFNHSTGSGSMLSMIGRLIIRLIILGFIALIAFWFYLSNRPGSEEFKEDVQQQIAIALNASEVKIANISKDKGGLLTGDMLVSELTLGETDNSFFEDWYVKEEDISIVGRRSVLEKKKTAILEGVHLSPFTIGDNYLSGWSGKELKILRMELKLKSGAETDALAMDAYSSLFKKYESLNIEKIQIFDATLLWGYSEISSGSIKGAQLNIVKGSDSWEINVTGGTFSHHWLKDAAINNMKVICKSSGEVVIESASLGLGGGELKFNASIQVNAKPEVIGNYSFDDVGVIDLIGDSYKNWLDGSIDGNGEFKGKLNSAEGIKFTTTVDLIAKSKSSIRKNTENGPRESRSDSFLVIRGDNIKLLKVLQMRDIRNSYSLLRAHSGSLTIVNQGKDTEITVKDMFIGKNDFILMKGKLANSQKTIKPVKKDIDTTSLEMKEDEINPKKRSLENTDSDETLEKVKVFSGDVELGFIPEVFENNTKLLDLYPIDSPTLRVWLDINFSGQLGELTEDLADKLFEMMQEDENNE